MTAVAELLPQCQGIESVVRGEYDEMPGMRLTLAQACRLWNLRLDEGERVLGQLVRAGFLMRDASNRYYRSTDRR